MRSESHFQFSASSRQSRVKSPSFQMASIRAFAILLRLCCLGKAISKSLGLRDSSSTLKAYRAMFSRLYAWQLAVRSRLSSDMLPQAGALALRPPAFRRDPHSSSSAAGVESIRLPSMIYSEFSAVNASIGGFAFD